MTALLAVGEGSAISDCSAGAYWQLEGVTACVPEVLVRHERRMAIDGVRLHRSRTVEPSDITRRAWLTLTTPTRTLIDLCGSRSLDELEAAVDDALRRRLTTVARLTSRVGRIQGNVRGIGRLRRILADRTTGRMPESSLEARFGRELRRRGYRDVVPQHEVRDATGRLVARVDFAFPDAKLALEVDGAHHAGRRQWKSDLGRQNRLVLLGWRYLRFTADEVNGDPRVWTSIANVLGEPNSHVMG
jgi:very-short-patch-repair endonuclease